MLVLWTNILETDAQMSVRLNLGLDVLLKNQGSALKYVGRGHLTTITTSVTMETTRMEMDAINHATLKKVFSALVVVQIHMISAKRFVETVLTWDLPCVMTETISRVMVVVPLVKLRKAIFVKEEIQ
jgi:hypothetical protein